MQSFVLALHVIACLILIVVVLLQSGKEGMGVIFGGGSSSLFGSSGAGSLLGKITGVVATLFLITSLTYNMLSSPEKIADESLMDSAVQQQAVEEAKPTVEGIVVDEPGQEAESSAAATETAPSSATATPAE